MLNVSEEENCLDIKEVYKSLKKDIVGVRDFGYHQRIKLLLYGFLRKRSYRAIEKKTFADKLEPAVKESIYNVLVYDIAKEFKKRLNSKYELLYKTEEYQQIKKWVTGE